MTIQGCRRLSIFALALTLAFGAVQSTLASTFVLYTDKATFDANVFPPVQTDNFDDLTQGQAPTSISRTVGTYQFTLTSPTSNSLFVTGPTSPKDVWITSGSPTDTLTLTVNAGDPGAVGGNFFLLNSSNLMAAGSITVTINGGQSTTFTTTTNINDNFVGWVGAEGTISTITVTSNTANLTPTINNATFAVPEPSTYAMLGMGACFASLGVIRRRVKMARS